MVLPTTSPQLAILGELCRSFSIQDGVFFTVLILKEVFLMPARVNEVLKRYIYFMLGAQLLLFYPQIKMSISKN